MSISLRIATLSGKEVNIEIDLDSSVSDLMRRARDQLHAGIQCLISGSGVILDRWMTLSEASLNNEDTLRAMLRRAEVVPGSLSFALLRCDGRVVVWGDGKHSCKRYRDLVDIVQVRASSSAFAAIAWDKSVLTWGNPRLGGDPAKAPAKAVQLYSNYHAFAAILEDGKVFTWPSSG
ncbi:unnamed protein product [Durusdinium trenchii]|uniref:Ubiquitin-like domain-containing protein n=1 Tax=Durusdinium trenchii TaxID=1381693 RepID=A0ABP0JSZ0_9DINO